MEVGMQKTRGPGHSKYSGPDLKTFFTGLLDNDTHHIWLLA